MRYRFVVLAVALIACRRFHHRASADAGVSTMTMTTTVTATTASAAPSASIDPTAANGFALHKASCDSGDESGCISLGIDYEKGIGVAPDQARAAALYDRACAA